MTSPRRIAVITSSRADWNHLVWPLARMRHHDALDPRLIVTGSHLAPTYGMTVQEITAAGFDVAERIECLLSSDTESAMAKSIGLATISFADAFERMNPDLVLIIADRFEMLAPANAALAMRIPIAHIEGGERSEGAIDHAIRNALTMMSHVHFTTTARAAERVASMGEEPWRIHQVGAPSLDHLMHSSLLDRRETSKRVGVDLTQPTLVVAFHPVTLDDDPTEEAAFFLRALQRIDGVNIVVCAPNADAGRHAITRELQLFCDATAHAHWCVNLDPILYWSLLRHARAMAGNSSSGVMESTSLGLPAVNVGRRQHGREHADNVIDAPADTDAILQAMRTALTDDARTAARSMVSPYGDGHAGSRIADALAALPPRDVLLNKQAAP